MLVIFGILAVFALGYLSGSIRTSRLSLIKERFNLERRVPCPCCGYPTLTERGAYDICRLCGWEDDGADDDSELDLRIEEVRDQSLGVARGRFQSFRSVYSPDDERSNNPTEHEVKGLLMRAFEALSACGQEEKESIEIEIACFERILDAETSRSVAKHDARTRHVT